MFSYTHNGAFPKTQRHNFNGHKNTNLCLFNPIFNPIKCMSVIKTQICRTSPPHCANLCPDISLTYFYFPRENFIFRLDVTPAARRLRTSSHAAATTAFVARCLSPPPPPPAPLPHWDAASADAKSAEHNGYDYGEYDGSECFRFSSKWRCCEHVRHVCW